MQQWSFICGREDKSVFVVAPTATTHTVATQCWRGSMRLSKYKKVEGGRMCCNRHSRCYLSTMSMSGERVDPGKIGLYDEGVMERSPPDVEWWLRNEITVVEPSFLSGCHNVQPWICVKSSMLLPVADQQYSLLLILWSLQICLRDDSGGRNINGRRPAGLWHHVLWLQQPEGEPDMQDILHIAGKRGWWHDLKMSSHVSTRVDRMQARDLEMTVISWSKLKMWIIKIQMLWAMTSREETWNTNIPVISTLK